VIRKALCGMLLIALAVSMAGAEELLKLDGFKADGWTVAEGPKTWIGATVEEKIDGFVVFHQGFNLGSTQWALLKQGDAALDVFVFTYDTPANAYGLYTVMRQTVMQAAGVEAVPVGDEGTFHPMGQLVSWVGRQCIVITTAAPKPPDRDAFVAIAAKLAGQAKTKSEKPELVAKLPGEGLEPASVLYCHYRQPLDQVFYVGEENVLGLGTDLAVPTQVEAVFARYSVDNRLHQLIVVRYPDEQAAAKAADAYAATVEPEAKGQQAQGGWRDFTLRNGKHTLVYYNAKVVAIAPEAVAVDKVRAIIETISPTPAPPPAPEMGGG
jgi:Family of unknown function (DUF6599)